MQRRPDDTFGPCRSDPVSKPSAEPLISIPPSDSISFERIDRNTVFGLPAHILLVHAVVVLVPLAAIALVLCLLWPAARRRLVWPTLTLAVISAVLTPTTTQAGE